MAPAGCTRSRYVVAVTAPQDQPADALSYEQARDELVDVVKRLESGGLALAESLELWERGEQLADICSQWLEGARARLAAAQPGQDEPADPGAPF